MMREDQPFNQYSKIFSIALAITNIIGVPVGGFGVPFTSLSEGKAEKFLKVCILVPMS